MSYLPESLVSILDCFRGAFTAPSLANLKHLVCGWVLCIGRHSLSRVIQAAVNGDGGRQHAAFYRFFSRARWRPDALGRVVLELLLPHLPETIEATVDDTLCKKGGPQIFGAAMHRDGAASSARSVAGGGPRFAFGHNWVVLSVWVPLPWAPRRGMAVPVLTRLYRGRKGCPEEEYHKRTDVALEMIRLVASWLPASHRLAVAADSEYACCTIVRELPSQIGFVGPVRMDAALHEEPRKRVPGQKGRPAKKGPRLPTPGALAASKKRRWRRIRVELYGRRAELLVKTIVCLWPKVAGSRPVRMVLTRDPRGRFKERAYFCTDTRLTAEEILTRFAHRWEIEVCFRNAKQLLGLDDPQNGWWRRRQGERRSARRPGAEPRGERGRHAVERTVPIGLLVQAVVIVWYLRHGDAARDVGAMQRLAPWNRRKLQPSFGDMLGALRVELWRHRLSEHPLPERVRRKLEDLIAPAWRAAA
jgi:hypothetical protein